MDQFLTLKDASVFDGADMMVGLIEDVVNIAPEIDRVVGRVIEDISYDALVRKAIHSQVGFRRVNQGVPLGASSYDTRRFNCFAFDGQMRVDEALVTRGRSLANLMTFEGTGVMRAKAIDLGKQFYQGTLNDAEGCPGLTDFMTTQQTEIDSRTGAAIDQVVDATGSTASHYQVCWFANVGPQGVHWLFGGGRGLILNPWIWQQVSDANGKKYRAYCSNVFGYIGTSCASVHAVGAIKNIQDNTTTYTEAGHCLTDSLVAKLWAKFPIGMKPNIAFASQAVIALLQLSRSVTLFANADQSGASNSGGAAPIAPWPTDLPTAGGIPIVPTDSIVASVGAAPF